MKIIFSTHAEIRMKEHRQYGITRFDVIKAVKRLPGKASSPHGYRIKNNISKSGKKFEVVIVDKEDCRNIITVVGLPK